MTAYESARRKLNENRAYPSDTPYFFGMTQDENATFAHPYPLISECDVTVHDNGTVSFSRKPTGGLACVKVSAELVAVPIIRAMNLRRDDVKIVVQG